VVWPVEFWLRRIPMCAYLRPTSLQLVRGLRSGRNMIQLQKMDLKLL